MKRLLPFVALATVVLVTSSAQASLVNVAMFDNRFDASVIAVNLGDQVVWVNEGGNRHSSTQNPGLSRWDTGLLDPGEGQGVVMRFAGAFNYHCRRHGDPGAGMHGRVNVLGRISPGSGEVGDDFTLRSGNRNAPPGHVFDIQVRHETAAFTPFQTGITSATTVFTPDDTGLYEFRMRLRRPGHGASGWSPIVPVEIT